ncbi:beta-ketoacyl-[acyl-carrier-protein] synthase family protein [Nonlabens sp.]|uniref:beta-ketoacyl-[acyl-carrier-protein] synthase family protein n=1 Tax=Nonlabens sp. TaxID=1888209 RepID=UPI0025DF1A8C|nr:beta-ketoacyl-[acyl-carrier-protein] synthase family protein [Nonlabens sp.]
MNTDNNRRRVVITGMGVVAPNAIGVSAFAKALQEQTSGIRFDPQLADLNFGCQVSGTPQITEELLADNFTPLQLRGLKASGLVYGVIAGKEAFKDAALHIAGPEKALSEMGIIFGTGQSGGEKFREAIHLIDDKKVRRLGSTSVIQTMTSGISAWLAGELGCGNIVTSNSSACCTGTEAFLMGYERIAAGKATQMLVGSTSDSGPYIWGGFDAMRILPTKYNQDPENASRPLSEDAAGFVPGSGAGAFILEHLGSAQKRGAKIYAEVLGGAVNSGGHRADGSMTAPNGQAVQDCIHLAMKDAGVTATEIDAINGHLTATSKDAFEIKNWSTALKLKGAEFPFINTFKSCIGHCLAAAGSIELVGAVLQLKEQKIYGNSNITSIHPEIMDVIDKKSFPLSSKYVDLNILAKASFGFGDVNACVLLKKYSS